LDAASTATATPALMLFFAFLGEARARAAALARRFSAGTRWEDVFLVIFRVGSAFGAIRVNFYIVCINKKNYFFVCEIFFVKPK
jgi:hypothetical protein